MSFLLFAIGAIANGGAAHVAEPLVGTDPDAQPVIGYEATVYAPEVFIETQPSLPVARPAPPAPAARTVASPRITTAPVASSPVASTAVTSPPATSRRSSSAVSSASLSAATLPPPPPVPVATQTPRRAAAAQTQSSSARTPSITVVRPSETRRVANQAPPTVATPTQQLRTPNRQSQPGRIAQSPARRAVTQAPPPVPVARQVQRQSAAPRYPAPPPVPQTAPQQYAPQQSVPSYTQGTRYASASSANYLRDRDDCAARTYGQPGGFAACTERAVASADRLRKSRWRELMEYFPRGARSDVARQRSALQSEQDDWQRFYDNACLAYSASPYGNQQAVSVDVNCQLEILNARIGRLDMLIDAVEG